MKATKCFHKLSGSKIFNIGWWHFMHSHGRKIHNRISPCIHPSPSFYQPPVNYKCISFIVNSKYLILKAIILFRKTGVIDFNSGEQTRCANFIKAYCIFFASVLCQFVDKPLVYFICNAFHNAWEQQRLQKRETHFEAGKVLATLKIGFLFFAPERGLAGRAGVCLRLITFQCYKCLSISSFL